MLIAKPALSSNAKINKKRMNREDLDEARRRVPTASSGLIRRSIPKLDPQRNQRLYTGVGAPTALAVDRVAGSLTQFEDEQTIMQTIEKMAISRI
jgi:hypothetical protein